MEKLRLEEVWGSGGRWPFPKNSLPFSLSLSLQCARLWNPEVTTDRRIVIKRPDCAADAAERKNTALRRRRLSARTQQYSQSCENAWLHSFHFAWARELFYFNTKQTRTSLRLGKEVVPHSPSLLVDFCYKSHDRITADSTTKTESY